MKKLALITFLLCSITTFASAGESPKATNDEPCTKTVTSSSTVTVDCGNGITVSSTFSSTITYTGENCEVALAVATIMSQVAASAIADDNVGNVQAMCPGRP
jgi:hypothetical protein